MADAAFEFDDTKAFEDNLDAFSADIASADLILAGAMKSLLPSIAAGKLSNGEVWDALVSVIAKKDAEEPKLTGEPAALEATNDGKVP